MKRLASLSVLVWAGCLFSASAWADDVVLNFGPEEIIKAQGKDIVVPGFSVPSFEDWNNDKLKDLIVGEGGGGAPGKIRVYLNRGTEADPCFVDYFYVQSKGQDLTVTPYGCLGAFPRLVPWSGDGHKDLLVGLGNGTVNVYLNIGSDNEPAFDGGTTLTVSDPSSPLTLDVGDRATPILVDWNDDGMMDIVAGDLKGYLHIYYNCGCGGYIPPRFTTTHWADGIYVQANGHDLLVSSGRSSPIVMDMDGDGKKDLLVGNTDGQIWFYRNTGTDVLPTFTAAPTPVQSNGKPLQQLPAGQRSRPALCHWTGDGHFGPKDGYWDLLVGYGDGKIHLYRGIPKIGDFNGDGAIDANDFTMLVEALDKPVPPGGSPCDLNHDGVVDNVDLRLFADLWLAEYGTAKK